MRRSLAMPGWVQIQALANLEPGKTDLDAAMGVSHAHMYVFTDEHGQSAYSREIVIADGWDCEGVIVPAIDAYEKGLIGAEELEEASRNWT